ncbi:uncharacterized protein MYCFIDRAFT_200267 [Pseudocercospora fijiensis CIRAD86]|uniref:Uncharacterized protein n=1 Tax=Pseudocercospora fijiensis (strain CIRAD86) TaxID=383855 RepID=M2YJF6_PSEFD|nr:uncharacterized protein MYCFIDRAFT_200267 [Pseudocercospora fijiensis CIRAD86]EME77870.1 hypothetical protein MYCFIDRAFT_200267 [Pseudocercospora fijiensis CIRAD86]
MSGNRQNKRAQGKEAVRLAATRNRQGDGIDRNRLQLSKKQWGTIIFLLLLFAGSIFEVVLRLSDALGPWVGPMAFISVAGTAAFFAWQGKRRDLQSRLQIRPGKEIKAEWQWPNQSAREDGVLRKPRDQKRADREIRKASPNAKKDDGRRDSVLAEGEPKREQEPESILTNSNL